MPRTCIYTFTSLCCHVVEMRRTFTAPPSPHAVFFENLKHTSNGFDSYTPHPEAKRHLVFHASSACELYSLLHCLLVCFLLCVPACVCLDPCLAARYASPKTNASTRFCHPDFCLLASPASRFLFHSHAILGSGYWHMPARSRQRLHTMHIRTAPHKHSHTPSLSPPLLPTDKACGVRAVLPPGVSSPASLHHAGHRYFVPVPGWPRCLGTGQSRPRAPTRHRAYASCTPCGRT